MAPYGLVGTLVAHEDVGVVSAIGFPTASADKMPMYICGMFCRIPWGPGLGICS